MRELPILFSAPMVRAILDGRKTVTRRIVKGVRGDNCLSLRKPTKTNVGIVTHVLDAVDRGLCPYGQPGDRLWVRETCRIVEHEPYGRVRVRYEADGSYGVADFPSRLKPVAVGKCVANGCHREAARITLEVTGVRVERLQDVSYESALAEGAMDGARFCEAMEPGKRNELGESSEDVARRLEWPQRNFRGIWEEINGAGSWDANPWVWVVEFKRIEQERKAA